MIIVGIGHKSRQGKDEFAKFLATHLRVHTRNKKIVTCGFADQLKIIAHMLYGWAGAQEPAHYEQYPDERNKKLDYFDNKTIVDLWIELGNHAREFDPYIWINALLRGTKCDVLIIKDTRFPNEFDAVHRFKGLTVKITRPGFEGLPSVSDNALNEETRWDHFIDNASTLKELYNKACDFSNDFIIPKLG